MPDEPTFTTDVWPPAQWGGGPLPPCTLVAAVDPRGYRSGASPGLFGFVCSTRATKEFCIQKVLNKIYLQIFFTNEYNFSRQI